MMKRTIPLLLTAVGGFVLIVAFFIPFSESWGERTAIWFDILASIAFILGGGNLLKVHLKKVSDRVAGWGYSVITVIAFLITLYAGLAKIGSPPAAKQEYFGETFAALPLEAIPESQVFRIKGEIPQRADDELLPPSVRRQISQDIDKKEIVFRGWMLPSQKQDLLNYQDDLAWQCNVEKLFKKAQPRETLKGRINYYVDHHALSFNGKMDDGAKNALLAMGTVKDNPLWIQAVDYIYEQSQVKTTIEVDEGDVPDTFKIPKSLKDVVIYNKEDGTLSVVGPLSTSGRDGLFNAFPRPKPLTSEQQRQFRDALEARGTPLTAKQAEQFDKYFDSLWTIEKLRVVLDIAGKASEEDKTACEMLAERDKGVTVINPKKKKGTDVSLNDVQVILLRRFASDEIRTHEELISALKIAGVFTASQKKSLEGFLSKTPTVGKRNKVLCFRLLKAGPLAKEQVDFLLADVRSESALRRVVGTLFVKAHVTKYPSSGVYDEQGSMFWWIYEYAFKPLTATMFAMLAFYVASAAFRAFRAKNVEATLLLATAFIILLGRTFAGVLLTSWIPESFSALRIDEMTFYIMKIFNTAGNRAIMIGIALGVASMSLKVLLGIDRSYLGSSED